MKYNLSRGRKIVVIVKPKGGKLLQLHYILILGYDKDNFEVYDPGISGGVYIGYTKDKNGEKIGNMSLSHYDLIDKMNKGHILGVAKDYALLVWK